MAEKTHQNSVRTGFPRDPWEGNAKQQKARGNFWTKLWYNLLINNKKAQTTITRNVYGNAGTIVKGRAHKLTGANRSSTATGWEGEVGVGSRIVSFSKIGSED